MRRKSLGIVAVLAALTCSFAGCSRTDKPAGDASGKPIAAKDGKARRLIVLSNGDDPYWDAMRAGMEDAAKDLNLSETGIVAQLDKNDGTSKGQVDKLKQYASQSDIAAVALTVTDNQNVSLVEEMKNLKAQGVKVITIDSDVDREKFGDARFAYLGTDNFVAGRELGRAVKALRPDGGNYAAFVGIKSAANAQERAAGFAEAVGDKFKLIEFLGDDMDLSVAQKNVRDALDRHPEIDTLVGIWAYNAHAIADTVKDRGIREKTTVVNFDAAPKALAHMEAGLIDALIVQDPYKMGYEGTKLMKALIDDDHAAIGAIIPAYEQDEHSITKPGGDVIVTGLKIVVPDGDKRLSKELFESTTEFIPFSEFKAWLSDKKLTGS